MSELKIVRQWPQAWARVASAYAEVTLFNEEGLCAFQLNTPEQCYDCGVPLEPNEAVSVSGGYRLCGSDPFHGPVFTYVCSRCAEERERYFNGNGEVE